MFKLKKTMLHANREREKYQFEIALSTLSGLAGLGERCERGPVLIQLTRGPKVLRSAVVDVKNGNATWTSVLASTVEHAYIIAHSHAGLMLDMGYSHAACWLWARINIHFTNLVWAIKSKTFGPQVMQVGSTHGWEGQPGLVS